MDKPLQILFKVTNPASGQSAKLSHSEYKLYHEIKDAEVKEDYTTMQKKLDTWLAKD